MVDARSSPARIRQFSVGSPGSGPYALTSGPDGALWITLVQSGQIARLEPGGRRDLYELDSTTRRPSQITTGPDDALWFTRPGDDRIGDDHHRWGGQRLPGHGRKRSVRDHGRRG